MASLVSSLAGLNLASSGSVKHSSAQSPQAWREELTKASGTPSSFKLLKTLVYKPKTAKSATVVPVIVIAAEDSETSSAAIGKVLELKELRFATPELLTEFFGLDKDSVSPLALNQDNFSKVLTVVDTSITSSSTPFALRNSSSSETVFLSGSDIIAHLKKLETEGSKIREINFDELKSSASGAPAGSGQAAQKSQAQAKEAAKIEGAVQIAIGFKKEVDFPDWYTSVLTKAEMIDYYSVSGCYILRPRSFNIWEEIQTWFNGKIKELGVQNAYFPMFISRDVLEKEKDHLEGFSPEVAWVTRAGQSDLEEPIAIRPTSETAMYPYYAKWLQSHRDLPLRLNQWNSVVRWEFKNPQPFLRTREFLWQEGHTAFLTKEEADTEVRQILDLYRRVYEELLAVPVIDGVKSEKEKFAGALYTTTIEGFIPTSGRGIQAATSHCLGQNFSAEKMFNIFVENDNKEKAYVWQNSWGLSTRTIGVMVMVHGDNQGLVLPPRVASTQVVVVPLGISAKTTDAERIAINKAADELASKLKSVGVKAIADLREGPTPGWKFNDWEQKGVPVRLEIGPKDIANKSTLSVRRDTGVKTPLKLDEITDAIPKLLETIQSDMYNKAKADYMSHLIPVTEWDKLVPALDSKNMVIIPWCEREACEDDIKERSGRAAEPQDERAPSAGAKSLCIPFDQSRWPPIEPGKTKCVACDMDAKRWTMFGRSY